jgi:hypothetical protein
VRVEVGRHIVKIGAVKFIESRSAAFGDILASSSDGSLTAVCDLHAIWYKLSREGDARP